MPGYCGILRRTSKLRCGSSAKEVARFGTGFSNLLRIAAVTGVAAIALFGSTGDALSNGNVCGDRDRIVASLTMQFSEQQVSVGVATNGGIFEVFASPSGSWTIIMTTPTGQSCFVASGEGWINAPSTAQGPKA